MKLMNHAVRCAMIGVLLVHLGTRAGAQDSQQGVDAEWNALVTKKAALVEQIEKIGTKFATAPQEEQQQLAKQAQTLQQEFQKNVAPRMVELAPQVYKANPQDVDAAEIMLQIHYSRMQYEEAAQVADGVLARDEDHQLALNIGGVANFATHNFEKSVRQLETAQGSGGLIPQLGGQYLDAARDYVQYWEKEQQIRQQESRATGNQQLPRVRMQTSKGDILLELFENEAPNTVANFVSLVEQDFYDGLAFHRVIPNFMAQGGDPNTREGSVGQPGTGGPGYTIECEAYEPDARRHFSGTLSMAHAGKDTGGSQFFITHLPTPHLDQEVRPESVHTVFGRVVEGLDVVRSLKEGDKIEDAEVLRKRDHEYAPETGPAR